MSNFCERFEKVMLPLYVSWSSMVILTIILHIVKDPEIHLFTALLFLLATVIFFSLAFYIIFGGIVNKIFYKLIKVRK